MITRTTTTILLADNSPDMRHGIRQSLQAEGYHVIDTDNARSALRLARYKRPDIIILDALLHDMSGYELCTHLRTLPIIMDVPILFLGVYHNADNIAQALDCGGDDYLRKPFAMNELSARIRALLRRATHRQFEPVPTLYLEESNYSVQINKRKVALTPTEFSLLDHLCENPATHHTANSLLETLWEYPPGGGDTALVRNHIRNLRRKIEDNPDQPKIIVSFHGRGYTINARVVNN